MRFVTVKAALALLATSLLSAVAPAATFIYSGILSAANEVPPTSSPGLGIALVSYTDASNSIFVSTSFAGLTSGTAAAHIHCCAPVGSNGPVATTTPYFAGFPLGVTNGSFSTTLDLASSSSYNPAFITTYGSIDAARVALLTGLASGLSYFNIHTADFPDGEIRAQLTPLQAAVPEPATWLLTIIGFGAVGATIRRRRQPLLTA